jgi:hypothetical protein
VIMSRSTRTRSRASLSLSAVAVLCLVTSLSGCSKKDEKKDTAKSTRTEQESDSTETAAAVKAAEVNIPDEQVPTEEDYEDQVEKQIKPDTNLAGELDKIEKEIGN